MLRPEITATVLNAAIQELSDVGYGRMSIEGVARRANVAKTAIYRRWRSKIELVLGLLSDAVAARIAIADTGTLRTDIEVVSTLLVKILQNPLASKVIPDLLAEAARSPQLQEALNAAIRRHQDEVASLLISRAAGRGELPEETDPQILVDLVVGPIYWRLSVLRAPTSAAYVRQLAEVVSIAVATHAKAAAP